jgi:hypothetical protein
MPNESTRQPTVLRNVPQKVRFEIFKRDGFRCIYCGATPVSTPLHCDHVVAIADGGSNDPSNLVTACSDCNLGKGVVRIEKKTLQPIATEADRDHADQIREYLAVQRTIEEAKTLAHEAIADRWQELIGPLSEEMFRRLRVVMKEWPIEKLEEAMQITGRKLESLGEEFDYDTSVHQAKYFHGILRSWKNEAAEER